MKRKVLAVVLSLVMALSLLAGCGGSAKKYEADIDALLEINDMEVVESLDGFTSLRKDVKKVDLVTDEGKAFQEAFLEMLDYGVDLYELMDKIDEVTTLEELENLQEDAEVLSEKVEKLDVELSELLDEFIDAAEEAGVDEDTIEDFEDEIK